MDCRQPLYAACLNKKVQEITGAWPIMISIYPASTAYYQVFAVMRKLRITLTYSYQVSQHEMVPVAVDAHLVSSA